MNFNGTKKIWVKRKGSKPISPKTSGQVDLSNREIKNVAAKTINAHISKLSKKFDDALWSYHNAYKMSISMSSYQLVFLKLVICPSSWNTRQCGH